MSTAIAWLVAQATGVLMPYLLAAAGALGAVATIYFKGRRDAAAKARRKRLEADLYARETRDEVEDEIADLSDAAVRDRLLRDAVEE